MFMENAHARVHISSSINHNIATTRTTQNKTKIQSPHFYIREERKTTESERVRKGGNYTGPQHPGTTLTKWRRQRGNGGPMCHEARNGQMTTINSNNEWLAVPSNSLRGVKFEAISVPPVSCVFKLMV